MPNMMFVSLPVTDLNASIAFYKALEFGQNPKFSDDSAACMVWSEAIYVMLVARAKWRTFTERPSGWIRRRFCRLINNPEMSRSKNPLDIKLGLQAATQS